MGYQNLTIFCFSGTGNSENVAQWLSAVAANHAVACSVYIIARIDRNFMPPVPADSLVVFVSPVHGFNYPPIMLNFIARFPKGKNNVLLMNTRAGLLIKNYNFPGLSGATFLWASLVLAIKGYSIVGNQSVDLCSNWILLHPGPKERTIQILHEKNKAKVFHIGEQVLAGKKMYAIFPEIILDVLVVPITIGYYLVGRFMLAKTFYTSADCNNCDVCIKNCPVHAIVKIDDKPFWTFKCESCMRCIGNCPKKSIGVAHGFIFSYCFVASALSGFLFYQFNTLFFAISTEIRYIVESILFLLFLCFFYRIIHYFMRFKLIERLMVYTSLTTYKFWRRPYKALKNF